MPFYWLTRTFRLVSLILPGLLCKHPLLYMLGVEKSPLYFGPQSLGVVTRFIWYFAKKKSLSLCYR